MSLVLLSFSFVLVYSSIVMLFSGVKVQSHRRRALRRLADVTTRADRGTSFLGDWAAFAVWISRRTSSSRTYRANSRLVRRAGFFRSTAVHEYSAIRILGAGAMGAIGATTVFVGPMSTGFWPVASVLFGAVGYIAPGGALQRIAAARQRRIDQELPYFIDTLVILIRAGASIDQAFRSLRQLIDEALPEIHRTILYLISDLDSGKSYEVALRKWSDLLGHRAGPDLSALLLQSVTHGTSLAQPLTELSAREIEQRCVKARERGGRRMLQLTVVMVVFLLPPLLVLIGAPSISGLLENLMQVGTNR